MAGVELEREGPDVDRSTAVWDPWVERSLGGSDTVPRGASLDAASLIARPIAIRRNLFSDNAFDRIDRLPVIDIMDVIGP